MGYDGTLEVRVTLERMRGTPLLHQGFGPKPNSPLDDKIGFMLSFLSSRLRTDRDAVARDLLRMLFFAVNWPQIANDDEQINRLLESGHRFNNS
jgi:hypothetical protein